jgi:hypothetical protein
MLYEIVVYHRSYPKATFEIYDWLEKKPNSKVDLLKLFEKRLAERLLNGYRIVAIRVMPSGISKQ